MLLDNRFNAFGAADVANNNSPPSAEIRTPGVDAVRFNIFGQNPLKTDVYTFVDANWPPHEYAKRMAQSGTTLVPNSTTIFQFNRTPSSGVPNRFTGTPNWGTPDGWGMFQIDHQGNCAVDPVPTTVLWNWMSNTEAGIKVMRQKVLDVDYREELYDTYLTTVPGIPQNIPTRPTLVTMYGVQLNARMACSIVAYNGFAGIPTFPALGTNYRTCWNFKHDTTTNTWSWVFYDNSRTINGVTVHYLQQILNTSE